MCDSLIMSKLRYQVTDSNARLIERSINTMIAQGIYIILALPSSPSHFCLLPYLPLLHPSLLTTRSPGTDSEAAAEDAAINHELGLSEDHYSRPEVSVLPQCLPASLFLLLGRFLVLPNLFFSTELFSFHIAFLCNLQKCLMYFSFCYSFTLFSSLLPLSLLYSVPYVPSRHSHLCPYPFYIQFPIPSHCLSHFCSSPFYLNVATPY